MFYKRMIKVLNMLWSMFNIRTEILITLIWYKNLNVDAYTNCIYDFTVSLSEHKCYMKI